MVDVDKYEQDLSKNCTRSKFVEIKFQIMTAIYLNEWARRRERKGRMINKGRENGEVWNYLFRIGYGLD